MPVHYGRDRLGTYVAGIDFSTPPTKEEAAALVAFGAQMRAGAIVSDTRQRKAALSSAAADTRTSEAAARDALILAAAQQLREKHSEWSNNRIARKLARTGDFGRRLKADTIARKLRLPKKLR